MRLEMNDQRERRFETLLEATGENAKAKALDYAAAFYIKMAGTTGRLNRRGRGVDGTCG